MTLISSTTVAIQAHKMGQTAREHTEISMAAQAQMEAVRAFRDNISWQKFLNGNISMDEADGGPSQFTEAYQGLLLKNSTGCKVTSPCLHMAKTGQPTFVPQPGSMDGPLSTSYIEIAATPEPGASPNNVEIKVNYGFEVLGGGKYNGHIVTNFTNLQAGPPPTPVPVVLPPVTPTPAPTPSPTPDPGGGAAIIDVCPPLPECPDTGADPNGRYEYYDEFVNDSPAGSAVAGCTWDWGDGKQTSNQACKPGDVIGHTYPTLSGLKPYPVSCWDDTTYIVTLTMRYSNGKSASNTYEVYMPDCY
jgi:hypothetical protein